MGVEEVTPHVEEETSDEKVITSNEEAPLEKEIISVEVTDEEQAPTEELRISDEAAGTSIEKEETPNEEKVTSCEEEMLSNEKEITYNAEKVSSNEELPLENEVSSVKVTTEEQDSKEIENDETSSDNMSQESESSTLVEFEAFNKEDKSPVTFLIDSKMLEKLLIGSKSKIVITDFEILSSVPVRNKSGDSGVISQDEEVEEKQDPAMAAIYKEFADQQRRISFAQIHNEKEKSVPKTPPSKNVSAEAMSTNLFLGGSSIKFDLDEKLKIIGTNVSPSANVIWKRTAAV